ncbi:Hsp70 family protein [Rhodococcus sp. H29-C3]|uniref:Hsp70 family protein n=1 Tax=Rhodococcus sp. H29-C3 TaxID=3046307 RepID=UPI0024BB07DA|nr:Hsp70 family protein [Rhodococcus sp. H29-C3]MDJ0361758.1 Hsp70 family protein [Rhodococcus sp. H29-C3]
MKVGIGVSTGTEVVCAALVVVDEDGSHTVEYRTVSADSEANTDIGQLVTSAIELMTTLAPAPAGQGAHSTGRREPDTIAVSYRTPEQSSSIRSACSSSRRAVSLIPESAASHAFLADSGLIARYGTVSVVDLGASGSTVTIIDAQSGLVHAYEPRDEFGGDAVNNLVKELVRGRPERESRSREDNRSNDSARYRTVKEHLSTYDSASISHDGVTTTVSRTEFDALIRPSVTKLVRRITQAADRTGRAPEAVVLIGGGAHIPLVRTVVESELGLPVLTVDEPDAVLATGAAHVALTAAQGLYPTVGATAGSPVRSVGRYSGALVGAFLVAGIVLVYGIQALTPSDDTGYSPAGTEVPSEQQSDQSKASIVDGTTISAADPRATTTSTEVSTGNPTSAQMSASASATSERSSVTDVAPTPTSWPAASTPTLHPAPDLPLIPFPTLPNWGEIVPLPDSTTIAPPSPTPSIPESTPPESTPPQATPPLATPPLATPSETTPTGVPSVTSSESVPVLPPGVPTADAGGTPTPPSPPELTPPPTVWSPPAIVPANPASPSDDTADSTAGAPVQPTSGPVTTNQPATTN